jgi:hypothetical protein
LARPGNHQAIHRKTLNVGTVTIDLFFSICGITDATNFSGDIFFIICAVQAGATAFRVHITANQESHGGSVP